MDADLLFQAELRRHGAREVGELTEDEIVELGLRYSIWLPTQTYLETPWLAPFAVRRTRIRTDPNAPGPPRDLWGFPDPAGYFTDDNSLIKGVVRGRRVEGDRSPYGENKLSTGLVCCHVWPGTTSNPLLFSFVPNLVWLPRSLAGFSDAHFRTRDPHPLHFALRGISFGRFYGLTPAVAVDRTFSAWGQLDPLSERDRGCLGGSTSQLTEADVISRSAGRRIQRVARFLDELEAGKLPLRRVSRRYHAGVGARIDRTVPAVQSFVTPGALRSLRAALGEVSPHLESDPI